MKVLTAFLFSILLCLTGQAQTSVIDSSLARRITVSGFCLCQTTLADLQQLTNNLKEVEVEEMDLPKNCFGQDTRFENGKGYSSVKYPGIILQKDQSTDFISKIRLTKDFKGNLPDGTPIDMQNLTLKDIFKIYPELSENWGSRGCSPYWHFSNDTVLFYVKIDPNKKPQFPVDKAYYMDKPIEGIDIRISCYSIFERANQQKRELKEPIFFIDSVEVTTKELEKYQPTDIATVTVYKDSNAVKRVGPKARNGLVYIETKKFAKKRYWNFLQGKSSAYLEAVPSSESDSAVVYILNGKVLKENFEGDLSLLDDATFISLEVIDKQKLIKDYGINDRTVGVVIKSNKKTDSKQSK